VFEIVGTDGCIESRERSGDGLLRLNRTILACVGQVLGAATSLTCFTGARAPARLWPRRLYFRRLTSLWMSSYRSLTTTSGAGLSDVSRPLTF
jgi:hypothetical protein